MASYFLMMLSTGPSPLTKGTSGRTARMLPTSGFWIPIATIATVTAMMMERQAISVADILERPRQPQNQTKNHTDDIPPDSAHGMISDSIHSNRKAEHMCTLNKDQDENLSQSEDISQNRPTNQHTTVRKRLHRRMGQLEFADDPTSICGNDTEEKDAEETGDETEDGESLRKGQNAQGNVLGEH